MPVSKKISLFFGRIQIEVNKFLALRRFSLVAIYVPRNTSRFLFHCTLSASLATQRSVCSSHSFSIWRQKPGVLIITNYFLLTIMKGTIASWRLIPPCPTTTSPLLLKALSEQASKGYVPFGRPISGPGHTITES